MLDKSRYDGIPLPNGWPRHVRSAVVHAENHFNARVGLQAENDRLRRDVSLLLEEIRIKDARMERVPAQAARHLLVTPLTIASWTQRLDDEGPDALVQVRERVNRFAASIAWAGR